MARLTQARRKVSMILVKVMSNGTPFYVREPYNVVALDWGDGTPILTYIEPAGTLLKQPSADCANSDADASARPDTYDELRVYDSPPFPKTRIGVVGI